MQKMDLLRSLKVILLFSVDLGSSLSDGMYYYRAKDVDEGMFAHLGGFELWTGVCTW
ncbi:MAG: hypothetical protein LBQ98_08680 [Nitrososphaerota archaeon]|jgi:hypothetical protein|nr:hypothetical protein [Nitrososphaerota archaeon]